MVDWGSVPDWIAGIGAATALYFARAAAIYTRKASEEQAAQVTTLEAESRRNNEIERRRLASKVAVYIGIQRRASGVSPLVRFVNSGDLPIYSLTVSCFTPWRIVERRYFVNGPQTERRSLELLTQRLSELFDDTDPRPLIGRGQLVASCSFRDAAGVWWYRACRGELHEADDEEQAVRLGRASGPVEEPIEIVEDDR